MGDAGAGGKGRVRSDGWRIARHRRRGWRGPGMALLLLVTDLLAAVAAGAPTAEARFADAAAVAPDPQVAISPDGMVVTAHPLATRAGVRMLEAGGNAVDAAVAAAFALAVVEPTMNGLGGRTQILLRTPSGELHGIDATTQAPATYDPDTAPRASYGYGVVGVPGTVAGLTKALADHGSLPLATVLAPAVDYAENGFRLLAGEAERQAAVADELAESEGARGTFLKPDGSTYRAGELFVQEDLAWTLRTIARGGADAFYRGIVADLIARDMEAHDGHVTREALAAYEAEDVPVVRGSYRGYELAGTWVPSYGAITTEILHILETLPMGELSEAGWAAAVSQAIDLAYEDRSEQRTWDDARRLTSKEHAARRAEAIRLPAEVGGGAFGSVPTPAAAGFGTPARTTPPSLESLATTPGHTTHLSTADSRGMVVALTQSNGPNAGSRVVTPGLGFLYAATLGGYLGRMEPGERARSHISPYLVLDGGEPYLVLGAAGGSRIISAIVSVVSRVVDHGMSLPAAMAAPRVHPTGDGISAETHIPVGWSPEVLGRLEAMGFEVEPVPRTGAFGRIHGIQRDAARGVWIGVADPDWEGTAAGPRGDGR